MSARPAPEPFIVEDQGAWHAWLLANDAHSDGVWLALAKTGTTQPTSLTYQDALDEALCSGWIDGQRRSFDEAVFLQRFTPRRPRSVWSQRNVAAVARLEADGRMRSRGTAEVELARADGRWERAYAGAATVEIPAELRAALERNPGASTAFAALSRSEQYTLLHPVISAPSEALQSQRIQTLLERLLRFN